MSRRCGPCNATGVCDMCDGKGKHKYHDGGKLDTCGHCKGTGVCRYCGGTGDPDSNVAKDLWYGRKDLTQVAKKKRGCCGCIIFVIILGILYLMATGG